MRHDFELLDAAMRRHARHLALSRAAAVCVVLAMLAVVRACGG